MQFTTRTADDRWLLPEGIEEVLPEEAARMENLRRLILDRFELWGYRQVITPLIEYLDALLTGAGHDLDLQTFKLTDQDSGRMLGLRADMTPQVARIDARSSRLDVPARFCYLGTVLRARTHHLEKTRTPMQVGAEIYGHAGIGADVEIIRLMLDVMGLCGIGNVHLDLGHVGIFHELARQAGLSQAQESAIFSLLQQKAAPDLAVYLAALDLPAGPAAHLRGLPELYGPEALSRAREVLADAGPKVYAALDELEGLGRQLKHFMPTLPIQFDLTELRGYRYQTGIVFAAFVPGQGREIARGGRYNDVGGSFGAARPATGFSADLRQWLRLLPDRRRYDHDEDWLGPVLAPTALYPDDWMLGARITSLRMTGRAVIELLDPASPDDALNGVTARKLGCSHFLVPGQGEQSWDMLQV